MTDGWQEDLSPIGASDWTREQARHLLDRAGFGGPPKEVARLAAMPPEAAVAWFIDFKAIDDGHLPPFEHSGIYDPSLTPFPPTRPAATKRPRSEVPFVPRLLCRPWSRAFPVHDRHGSPRCATPRAKIAWR